MIEFVEPRQVTPKNLLPAFLLRLRREVIEERLGRKFSEFEDEDGVWYGVFVKLPQGFCAVLMLSGVDLTPSLFLPMDVQNDVGALEKVLGELKLKESDLVLRDSGFSGEQIRAGAYIHS